MAATLDFFMLPEDEKALFRLLARHQITCYPELFPPGWTPPVASEETVGQLTETMRCVVRFAVRSPSS